MRSIAICGLVLAAAVALVVSGTAPARPASGSRVTVYASGLNNPRGLIFGPDRMLYVAEGGIGGTQAMSASDCPQVPEPIGPYGGGFTSRIARIAPGGARVFVADTLPSSQTSAASGALVSGVAALAFVGNRLYGVEAGAGCSHGLGHTANTVFRVNRDGTTADVANLSAFAATHPVAQPEDEDFEPDETWYSLVDVAGALYAVGPNHGELDRVLPSTGAISRVVDISASQGHIVPTALAYDRGSFYVGNLGTFPVKPGSSVILKVTPSGQVSKWASGLSTVLGLAFDRKHRLYALESMTAPGFPGPNELHTGKIVRIGPNGSQTTVATGFSFPTGMTMGPDNALYVSNFGFGGPPGAGQILRVTLPA